MPRSIEAKALKKALDQERRKAAAAAKGKVFIQKKPTGIKATNATEWRREYKRIKRQEAGARSLNEIKKTAQDKRDAATKKKAEKELKILHDAHVKHFARLNYAKFKYWENPDKHRSRQSLRKNALVDSYVVYNLKVSGIPDAAINPQLIELKRESMEYKRLQKMLKTAIKNNWKETNETIRKHA